MKLFLWCFLNSCILFFGRRKKVILFFVESWIPLFRIGLDNLPKASTQLLKDCQCVSCPQTVMLLSNLSCLFCFSYWLTCSKYFCWSFWIKLRLCIFYVLLLNRLNISSNELQGHKSHICSHKTYSPIFDNLYLGIFMIANPIFVLK